MSNEIQRQIAKPTINLLFEEKLSEIIPVEQLNVILSTPPPDVWIKTHPFIKDHKYLPIDKVEYLLRSCFKKFQIEVKEIKQLFNAIQCTVRVHYLNPATNEMMFHDGVGAWDLQTQSKSGPLKMDISNINSGAVPMATGIAKTIAIKDACDHFGSLFGANLNRKDVINFAGNAELLAMGVGESDLVELFELKKNELSNDELIDAKRIIGNREIASYTKLSNLLKSK